MLPKLISENQSGFVKGRLITKSVLLGQEIVQGISEHNTGGNVVIKLDMAKAYDEMDWSFIIAVLRRFGFSEGQGLKQGDPLSPSLLILDAEVFSRMLNSLYQKNDFIPFSMSTKGSNINHLSYADDIVIFSSENSRSLKLIMKQIHKYEKSSGQRVNDDKSFFLTSPKAGSYKINRISDITYFRNKDFPFTYLGYPIYIGRKKVEYFDNMLSKVVIRSNGWQGNMLSNDGRMILIKQVLQSLPIDTMTTLKPPKSIINLMEKHFARLPSGDPLGNVLGKMCLQEWEPNDHVFS
ncbi:uncharacterized protein LOC129903519 [Solanum dulcamara]|uniref:uncharacterized protein LOC129903519 n=1 Tax=Solanum dulcamara TaxID=45834 RepID=UPI002486C64D|nr:uncharacterized protein LOC129903519 [Solanum dulcamara]